jgi:hypothetical protein
MLNRLYNSKLKFACLALVVLLVAVYGRGYYYEFLNDGFTVENISSDYAYDSSRDVRALSVKEAALTDMVLNQKFTYLGKGYQFYAFLSDDGDYVLKFFKYKRLRTPVWLQYFDFIPAVKQYRLENIQKKQKKLNGVFNSCKVAFDHLSDEAGLVCVHLNKTGTLNKSVIVVDKMEETHSIELDQTEFLLQKKAEMLGAYIDQLIGSGQIVEAKQLLSQIVEVILSEYARGLSDNDHALLPNTGVIAGHPVHIDVGQFVLNEDVKMPHVYKQELFSKTYKLNAWLKNRYPELSQYLEIELRNIIGDQFDFYRPSGQNLSGRPQFEG